MGLFEFNICIYFLGTVSDIHLVQFNTYLTDLSISSIFDILVLYTIKILEIEEIWNDVLLDL